MWFEGLLALNVKNSFKYRNYGSHWITTVYLIVMFGVSSYSQWYNIRRHVISIILLFGKWPYFNDSRPKGHRFDSCWMMIWLMNTTLLKNFHFIHTGFCRVKKSEVLSVVSRFQRSRKVSLVKVWEKKFCFKLRGMFILFLSKFSY